MKTPWILCTEKLPNGVGSYWITCVDVWKNNERNVYKATEIFQCAKHSEKEMLEDYGSIFSARGPSSNCIHQEEMYNGVVAWCENIEPEPYDGELSK